MIAPHVEALGLPAGVARVLSLTVAFGTITMLHIVIGEQAPKYFAIQQSERVVLLCARLMQIFFFATYPFVRVLNAARTASCASSASTARRRSTELRPRGRLRLIVQAAFRQGSLEGPQRDLLERVLRARVAACAPYGAAVDMSVLSVESDLDRPSRACAAKATAATRSASRTIPTASSDVYTKDSGRPRAHCVADCRLCVEDILFVPEARTLAEVLRTSAPHNTPIASWLTSTAEPAGS